MTDDETKRHKEIIDSMSQEDMARLWRFAPAGHPYFDRRLTLFDYFSAKFKGFTPEISKKLAGKLG